MSRDWQVFEAPGEEEGPLLPEPNPWVTERLVYLPLEQWELLLARARQADPAVAAMLAKSTTSNDADYNPFSDTPVKELDEAARFLDGLAREVEAGPDLPPPSESPDEYESSEHARMLRSVAAVFHEAVRLDGQPCAWLD